MQWIVALVLGASGFLAIKCRQWPPPAYSMGLGESVLRMQWGSLVSHEEAHTSRGLLLWWCATVSHELVCLALQIPPQEAGIGCYNLGFPLASRTSLDTSAHQSWPSE